MANRHVAGNTAGKTAGKSTIRQENGQRPVIGRTYFLWRGRFAVFGRRGGCNGADVVAAKVETANESRKQIAHH
jgi:hypothetical protein